MHVLSTLLIITLYCKYTAGECPEDAIKVEELIQRGKVLENAAFWTGKMEDITDCAVGCVRRKVCKSFNYDMLKKRCDLNSAVKGKETFRETTEGHVHSYISKWPLSKIDPSCSSRPCTDHQVCLPQLFASQDKCSYICIDLTIYKSKCSGEASCRIINGICKEGLCECPGGKKYDGVKKECIADITTTTTSTTTPRTTTTTAPPATTTPTTRTTTAPPTTTTSTTTTFIAPPATTTPTTRTTTAPPTTTTSTTTTFIAPPATTTPTTRTTAAPPATTTSTTTTFIAPPATTTPTTRTTTTPPTTSTSTTMTTAAPPATTTSTTTISTAPPATTTTTTTTPPPTQYNTSCSVDKDCTQANTGCVTGTCQCVGGYKLQPSNATCVSDCGEYGSSYLKIPGVWLYLKLSTKPKYLTAGECQDECTSELSCRSYNYCIFRTCFLKASTELENPKSMKNRTHCNHYVRNCN